MYNQVPKQISRLTTLGPAYNEFGYDEQIMSKLFSWKPALLIEINVKNVSCHEYHLQQKIFMN